MADDRHYVPGDNYLLDDLSGFKIRASRARVIPGGITGNLAVAPQRWEPQQPQDFVKGVPDDQTVALSRPRQRNQFILLGTNVTAFSARGDMSITIASPRKWQVGFGAQIMLDSGVNFITAVSAITNNVFTLAQPLPASVGGSIGDPIENLVLALNQATPPFYFVLDEPGEDILDFNVLA